jgi:hypothetical protein
MLVLPIHPAIGAGPIRLGMSKGEARRTLEAAGYPPSAERREVDYFCENAVQLEYEGGHLRFIGISDHQEIKCTFGIVDVFDCAAPELFRLFATGETRQLSAAPGEACFFHLKA